MITEPRILKPSTPNGKMILEKLLAIELFNQTDLSGNKRKMTIAELMHVKMVQKALAGDIKAYAEVLDRVEGKAIQKIEEKSEHTFVSKPLSELVQFVKPKKTLDEENAIAVELKEVEPGSFSLDTSEDIEEGMDVDTD